MNSSRRKELEEKALLGTITLEDMQEVVADLRKGRLSAGFASKSAKAKQVRTKKVKQTDMAEDLFKDLQGELDI